MLVVYEDKDKMAVTLEEEDGSPMLYPMPKQMKDIAQRKDSPHFQDLVKRVWIQDGKMYPNHTIKWWNEKTKKAEPYDSAYLTDLLNLKTKE